MEPVSSFIPRMDKKNLFSFWLYGKVPLTFFIISIILFIVGLSINYYKIPISLFGLIFTPILTSLIVILINIHDSKDKNEFILNLLINEMGHNLLTLHENNQNIENENKMIKNKKRSPKALYSLKLNIWDYSINTLSINPFKKFMDYYNGFIYESIRYNETLNFRSTMRVADYNDFGSALKKKNESLLELGEYAFDHLTSALKTIGNLSIIDTEYLKTQDEIIQQLKEDGFSSKQREQCLKNINDTLSSYSGLYYIFYYYQLQ